MPPRKILLVSYLFPPAGGIAVQRILSLARYLPPLGYEVHVLTAGNPGVPTLDPSLLRLVPPEVRVHRTFTPEVPYAMRSKIWSLLGAFSRGGRAPAAQAAAQADGAKGGRLGAFARRIFNPDPEVVWTPFAIRAGRRIVRRHAIDAMLVTTPPFSSLLVTNQLKREFPHLKLVSDFRDEWLDFYLSTFAYFRSPGILERARQIERATAELSDAVVTVTHRILERIRARYPGQPDSKFHWIPNGFDPQTFAGFRARPHGTAKVLVVLAGTVYNAATPSFHLDGLDRLPEAMRADFETRMVGRVSPDQAPLLEGRASCVRQVGFVPQAEALAHMEEADYLMLTMIDKEHQPGKAFEYLATGKPILAYTPPDSELAQLIRETGSGWCADPNDAAAIDAMLRRAWAARRGEVELPRRNPEAVALYERPRQAAMVADLIERALAHN